MGNVIDLNDRRLSWLTLRARCKACGHRWVAVARKDTNLRELECPGCGEERSTAVPADEAGHAI